MSVRGLFTGQHEPNGDDHTGDDHTEMRVARHEAGHARAARRGGFTVAEMVSLRDGRGYTKYYGDDQNVRENLVAILAGQEAEIAYLQEQGYSRKKALALTTPGASGDLAAFAEESRGTGYTIDDLRPEARRLVRRHASTIESNARKLARNGRRGGTWA